MLFVSHKTNGPFAKRNFFSIVQLQLASFLLTALFPTNAADDTVFNIEILHTNDVLGRFDETDVGSSICCEEYKAEKNRCVGGVSRIKRFLIHKFYNETEMYRVMIDAGNFLFGTIWYRTHKHELAGRLMEEVKPTAIALGFYDLDQGYDALKDYLFRLKGRVTVVAGNVEFVDTQLNEVLQSAKTFKDVKDKDNKKSVAFLGFVPKSIETYLQKIMPVKIKDEMEYIREEIKKQKAENQHVGIILASPYGYERDKQFAKESSDIDIIIGSYSQTFLYNGSKPPSTEKPEGPYPTVVVNKEGKRVLIVHAYGFAKYVGTLKVSFVNGDVASWSGNPVFLSNDKPKDFKVEEILHQYYPESEASHTVELSKTNVMLDASGPVCRIQECNLGNLIADALVNYVAANVYKGNDRWTSHPIGFIPATAIMVSVDKQHAMINQLDLIDAVPYTDRVVMGSIKGEHLFEALETSLDNMGQGGFLQYSGIHVVYDDKAGKVIGAEIRCGDCLVPKYESLDASKVYNIITIEYLTLGHEDFLVLEEEMFNKEIVQMAELLTMILWYCENVGLVHAEVGGRIAFQCSKGKIVPSSCGGGVNDEKIGAGRNGQKTWTPFYKLIVVFIILALFI